MTVNSQLCFYHCQLNTKCEILIGSYIYLDYGSRTCERYPGSIDHIQQDMQVGVALLAQFTQYVSVKIVLLSCSKNLTPLSKLLKDSICSL